MQTVAIILMVGIAASSAYPGNARFKRGSSSASASASSSSGGGSYGGGSAYNSGNLGGGGCPGFGCGFQSDPFSFGPGQNGYDLFARMFQQFASGFPYQQQLPYYPNSYNNGGGDDFNNFLRVGGGHSSSSSSSSGGPGNAGITFSETNHNGVKNSVTTVQDPTGRIQTYNSGPGGVQTRVLPNTRSGSGSGQGIYSAVSSNYNPNGSVTVQKASGSY